MYKSAINFFLDYSNNSAKYDYPDWSVNYVKEITNVWSWSPDDISQFTVIRHPVQPEPLAESIWIMYENWNHERVVHTWYCQESADLEQSMQEIKTKFL